MSVDPEAYGWTVDLENQMVHWQGGFSSPIVEMLDDVGFDTSDEPERARFIYVRMPPDDLVVGFDMHSIAPENYEDNPGH